MRRSSVKATVIQVGLLVSGETCISGLCKAIYMKRSHVLICIRCSVNEAGFRSTSSEYVEQLGNEH